MKATNNARPRARNTFVYDVDKGVEVGPIGMAFSAMLLLSLAAAVSGLLMMSGSY